MTSIASSATGFLLKPRRSKAVVNTFRSSSSSDRRSAALRFLFAASLKSRARIFGHDPPGLRKLTHRVGCAQHAAVFIRLSIFTDG
jgi:hypothetical protein